MTKDELLEHLSTLRLTPSEAAQLLGVSERSVRRWLEGEGIPGPAEAALRAWRRLDERYLPWKPHSIAVFGDDQDQISRMNEHNNLLDKLIKEVEARGGPANPWSVDLSKKKATFGPAEVSFYKLANGGFSPSTYHRRDRNPVEDDRVDIQDACYCIAKAFSVARKSNLALIEIAEYTQKNAKFFVRNGPSVLSQDETDRRIAKINNLADEFVALATSALNGKALYSQFEAILEQLHKLGFFPEITLVSAVARNMLSKA